MWDHSDTIQLQVTWKNDSSLTNFIFILKQFKGDHYKKHINKYFILRWTIKCNLDNIWDQLNTTQIRWYHYHFI